MSQIRPDLNTTLANVAKTFAQRARLNRQKAAEATASIDRIENSHMPDFYRETALRAVEEAEKWEARAAEAEGGYFLARVREDLNDPSFVQEFADVMSAAQDQGRVVYQSVLEDQRMQQGAAGAPSV